MSYLQLPLLHRACRDCFSHTNHDNAKRVFAMLMTSAVEQFPDGKAVITVAGSLTLGTSLNILDTQIQNLVDADVRELVMDLSAVDHADSAGLGLLIHTHGLLKAKQGTIRLTGVRPRVVELICMTNLDTVLLA